MGAPGVLGMLRTSTSTAGVGTRVAGSMTWSAGTGVHTFSLASQARHSSQSAAIKAVYVNYS